MSFIGQTERNPWHTILRRLVFLPGHVVAISIAAALLLLAWCGTWLEISGSRTNY